MFQLCVSPLDILISRRIPMVSVETCSYHSVKWGGGPSWPIRRQKEKNWVPLVRKEKRMLGRCKRKMPIAFCEDLLRAKTLQPLPFWLFFFYRSSGWGKDFQPVLWDANETPSFAGGEFLMEFHEMEPAFPDSSLWLWNWLSSRLKKKSTSHSIGDSGRFRYWNLPWVLGSVLSQW